MMGNALPDLHQMLLDAGLGRVADVIEREARPSIRLTAHPVADEAAIPLGASKLGGSPDLPPGFAWPRHDGFPLAFIAQINLADAAPYDVEKLLPPTGMLSFFYRDLTTYNHDSKQYNIVEKWKVFYTAMDEANLQRVPMPEPWPERREWGGPYSPRTLTTSTEITLPIYESFDDLSREELQDFFAVSNDLAGRRKEDYRTRMVHRMLGYLDPIQGMTLSSGDVLLLQVDTEENGMEWGDTGRIYFYLRKEELAARDFGEVQFFMECY